MVERGGETTTAPSGGGHHRVHPGNQPNGLSSADAWLEWVFFRVHTRCAAWVSRSFGDRSRRIFEILCALFAVGGLGLLVSLHAKYERETELSDNLKSAKHKSNSSSSIYAVHIIIEALGGEYNNRRSYWYSPEKGIVELSEKVRLELKVPTQTIQISESELGSWLWRALAGHDTILANAALIAFGAIGQLFIDDGSDRYYDLAKLGDTQNSWLFTKTAITLKTLFLLFSTSTLAAYTLRETQTRMLRFAYLIKQFVSNHQSYLQLVIAHLLDSLVFAPITLGMLSFLYEFFNDQFLALLILSLVWGCELFAAISLRSPIAIRILPHIIILYLAALHFYIFCAPLGFHYLALFTTLAFIGHAMFFFWNHFELPALLAGRVSPTRPRAVYLSSLSMGTPSSSINNTTTGGLSSSSSTGGVAPQCS